MPPTLPFGVPRPQPSQPEQRARDLSPRNQVRQASLSPGHKGFNDSAKRNEIEKKLIVKNYQREQEAAGLRISPEHAAYPEDMERVPAGHPSLSPRKSDAYNSPRLNELSKYSKRFFGKNKQEVASPTDYHSRRNYNEYDSKNIDNRFGSSNNISHQGTRLTSAKSSDSKGFGFSSLLQHHGKVDRDR